MASLTYSCPNTLPPCSSFPVESERHERLELQRCLLQALVLLEALARYCTRKTDLCRALQGCVVACAQAFARACLPQELTKANLRVDFPATILPSAVAAGTSGSAVQAARDCASVSAGGVLAAVVLRGSPLLWFEHVQRPQVEAELQFFDWLFGAVLQAPTPLIAILAPLRQLKQALDRHWVQRWEGKQTTQGY